MEYCKYGTVHRRIDDLFIGMWLGQKYGTVLGSLGTGFNGEVNMSMLQLVFWVL